MLTIEESYDLFANTLSWLDKSRLSENDDTLGNFVFEELSADAVSFLHQEMVDRLIDAKKIPADNRKEILDLRVDILEQLERMTSIEEYRTELVWGEIRNRVEKIKTRIQSNIS